MKKYVILLLLTPVIVLVSFLYRAERTNRFTNFPFNPKKDIAASLQVVLFFSQKSCSECLEIIDALNSLPGKYDVIGVVPDEEFRNVAEVRSVTHAAFPLFPRSKFYKYEPRFIPSIICTSRLGTIYMILPVVPSTKLLFVDFLERFNLLMDSFR